MAIYFYKNTHSLISEQKFGKLKIDPIMEIKSSHSLMQYFKSLPNCQQQSVKTSGIPWLSHEVCMKYSSKIVYMKYRKDYIKDKWHW